MTSVRCRCATGGLAALLLMSCPLALQAQTPSPPQPPPAAPQEKTRSQLLAELATAKETFRLHPADTAAREDYARLLYQAGEFWEARELALPLAQDPGAAAEALSLAGKLQYLTGHYPEAGVLFNRLIKARAGNVPGQVQAMVDLAFTDYQTNRFDRAKEIAFPPGVKLPNVDLMKAFDTAPYRLEWHLPEKVSRLPFVEREPLPLLTVELDGVPIQAFLDTGGDLFIVDDEIAAALGVQPVGASRGSFGGGLQADVKFARTKSLRLGDVTLHDVPVMILPTKRFSGLWPANKHRVGGILGTAILRQFLSTVDYREGQLVLRERSSDSALRLRRELAGKLAAEVPFVLAQTHIMLARGGLNGQAGLTFFVDSGLASEACFTAPVQTLMAAGIAVPETSVPKAEVGGGGGKFASGIFPIQSLELGELAQRDVEGSYGPLTPASYWARGFITDGLISHRFLRQYASWTIDFDAMTFLFEKRGAPPAPH